MAKNYDCNGDPCGEYGAALLEAQTLRDEIDSLRAELTLTDEVREAVEWAIAVTCTLPHDPIGPIQRERLRDWIARHGRDA